MSIDDGVRRQIWTSTNPAGHNQVCGPSAVFGHCFALCEDWIAAIVSKQERCRCKGRVCIAQAFNISNGDVFRWSEVRRSHSCG